jgi:hypothetical protein
MRCCAPIVTLAGLLLFAATAPVQADDALLLRGIERLFEVGWDTAVKARTDGDQIAAKIDELFPGDPRGGYAYVLVLTKQRRYADAIKRIDQVLESHTTDAQAWQTKIRLAMLTKDYAGALAGLEQLAKLVPAETDSDPAAEAGRQQHVSFLGRMIGYLEGPVDGAVGKPDLEACRAKIVAAIGEDRASMFDDGARQIREVFSSLAVERDEAVAEEQAAAKAEQQELVANLSEEKAGLDPKRDAIEQDREKLKENAKEEIESVLEEEKPLLEQLASIQSQALLVRRQRSLALSNLASVQIQMNNERDGLIRGQLSLQANQYSVLAARYEAQLNELQQRALLINRQRFLMRQRAGQNTAELAKQVSDLEQELAELDKREKRIEVQEKRGVRATPKTRNSRLLDAEMAAFTTYDEFPLLLEKQRVLDWFK